MKFFQHKHYLSGFHAYQIEPEVPELLHIGEQWISKDEPIKIETNRHWVFLQISGSSRWEVTGKIYTVEPGNCLIFPPQVILKQIHHDMPSKHHFFFAVIELEVVLARLFIPVTQQLANSVIFIEEAESLLLPFRQLIREVSLDLACRSLGLRITLDYLVLELFRLLEKGSKKELKDPLLVPLHAGVLQVKQLLDYQPGQHWKLEELARLSGLSTHHLVKCFTRDVGVAPHQYLMQVRIRQAKEMLSHSDISITALALELGFSSSQHFANIFRQIVATTPQQYRSQVRQPITLT